jgi:hypothetical protein
MKVEFDKYSLIVNGRRRLIRGGSFHYFRLPSKKLWQDRLKKIKEAGLNTVDFYFPWNYHSPAEGVYGFSGLRDVDYLMDLAENLGLYIIARPGPYICAEVDGGGFPGWLIAKKGVVLRCRENGRFKYSSEYMKHVRQWYEQIVPRIIKHKNVVLFQVENEYSSYISPKGLPRKVIKKVINLPINIRLPFRTKNSQRYLKELYNLTRKLGVKVPIFHNDLPPFWGITLDREGRKGLVDIVATDDYSFFGQDWKNSRFVTKTFLILDSLEKWLRPLNPESPLFITELQGGWFDGWGGKGYETFRKLMGPEHIDIITRTALAQGVTLFNYYMFCGGTNWGHLSAPCVYTSYDFGAPIEENGLTNKRYKAAKEINKFIKEYEEELCVTVEDKDVKATNKKVFYKARKNPKTETKFVFLRNLSRKDQTTKLSLSEQTISVPSFSMPIFVFKKGKSRPLVYSSYVPHKKKLQKTKSRTELLNWRFASISPQISPRLNDSSWQNIPKGKALDIDSLDSHYGYIWYRGTFFGSAEKITIDARHCFTIWLNGKLLNSFDNTVNLDDGPDLAKTVTFNIPGSLCRKGKNILTVLVESLGHKKNFEDDAKNPRGIISCQVGSRGIVWGIKGGLIGEEKGLTPIVDFEKVTQNLKWQKVSLPHFWPKEKEGLGLYQTTFTVDGDLKLPTGLVISQAFSKANIYLNGYLLGRYWERVGPQHKFYLPEGVLKPKDQNKLNIIIWKQTKKGGLGKVYLENY